jgi:quercetin 2,3-dioxygenase
VPEKSFEAEGAQYPPRDPIRQLVSLSTQWPTIDPFLFCAHHLDDYPVGNLDLGPDASLNGREMGSDFAGVDGWNMYHGRTVPGFPQHPHRGFETVTLVRTGLIDHSDSLGATARFGAGDVQWLTAGKGVVHAEMFPLVSSDEPNPLELFQIWVNLPAADKMVDPYFTMLWANDVPTVRMVDELGRATEVLVVAGRLADVAPCAPPPNSWASHAEADVAIWQISIEAGGSWILPKTIGEHTVRVLYFFDGVDLQIEQTVLRKSHAAVLETDRDLVLRAGAADVQCLVLQGRPIGEPVARYGPFVMNTEAEIRQAFADYQATQFGGWPWASEDPTHDAMATRFAKHPDGSVEIPAAN